MKWKKYFKLTHQRFVLPGIGVIDARANLKEETLLKAYNRKCPFIELTEEGKQKYFPEEKPKGKSKPKAT